MATNMLPPSTSIVSKKTQASQLIKLPSIHSINQQSSHSSRAIITGLSDPEKATTKRSTRATRQCPSLANMWRRIQGSDEWKDLIHPKLHPLLREEIVRYGELVSACYKAFDMDPSSGRYLECKHSRHCVLREVGLAECGYEVTKYVYATPGVDVPMDPGARVGRWIGYVAVAGDEEAQRLGRRDIVVSFRGTVTGTEWVANFMSALTPANLDPHEPRSSVKVESGFLSLYTSDDGSSFSQGSCREQLLTELSKLVKKYKNEDVSVTLAGHSMGSALALLFGYDLVELGIGGCQKEREVPVTVYSFGGPRVGNIGFKERCHELGLKVLRVANVKDPITKLPGVFLNEENLKALFGEDSSRGYGSCYAHVGVELTLDFFEVQNPTCVHDLEAYVGLLKCPNINNFNNLVPKDNNDFLSRASRFVMKRAKFEAWPWLDAARQVGNLVQFLGLI